MPISKLTPMVPWSPSQSSFRSDCIIRTLPIHAGFQVQINTDNIEERRKPMKKTTFILSLVFMITFVLTAGPALAADKPNIVVIMGRRHRHVEHRRLSPRHDGGDAPPTSTSWPLRARSLPTITAEASCTAGRASFVTGELPIRTGLTTVGQAGANIGMPDAAADHRHRAQGPWVTRPGNSARTILVT